MFIPFRFYIKFLIGFFSIYLIHLIYELSYYFDNFEEACDFSETTIYDYIIVGSGTAGGLLAHRLAGKHAKILVLEAGAHPNRLSAIPILGHSLQKSVYDWQFQTEPQEKACWALQEHRSNWPRGKIVGGSSQLNNLIYIRGHPDDFQSWFHAPSSMHLYNYTRDIEPYFQKVEAWMQTTDVNAEDLSGISRSFLESSQSLHLETTVHSNDRIHARPDFTPVKLTVDKQGKRWYPASGLRAHPRITLCTKCHVEKVVIDGNRAVGVKLWIGDKIQRLARSRHGVILSAGAVNTPKILMLSGVGPAEHLHHIGIPIKVPLDSVGMNLQDHITTGVDLIELPVEHGFDVLALASPWNLIEYLLWNSGVYSTGGCDAVAFLASSNTSSSGGRPDIQLLILPFGATIDSGAHFRHLGGISQATWQSYHLKFRAVKSSFTTTATILAALLHPNSSGWIRLRNKHFLTPPLIQPNYLTAPSDVDTLIEGIQAIKRVLTSRAMLQHGAHLNPKPLKACLCQGHNFDTYAYWECYVRHFTFTLYHPVGTCQLGACVNYDFRVKNTRNLYVVDASVLPNLPSANPVASILMVAEKAAEIIGGHFRSAIINAQCTVNDLILYNV